MLQNNFFKKNLILIIGIILVNFIFFSSVLAVNIEPLQSKINKDIKIKTKLALNVEVFRDEKADIYKNIQQQNITMGERAYGVTTPKSLQLIIALIIRDILGFVGILAVVYTIYGGYLFMFSNSNDEQINKGKSIIQYGIVGVLIMLMSFGIANYIYKTILESQGLNSNFETGTEEDLDMYNSSNKFLDQRYKDYMNKEQLENIEDYNN